MTDAYEVGISYVANWLMSLTKIKEKYPTAQLVNRSKDLAIVVDDKLVGYVEFETGGAYLYSQSYLYVSMDSYELPKEFAWGVPYPDVKKTTR